MCQAGERDGSRTRLPFPSCRSLREWKIRRENLNRNMRASIPVEQFARTFLPDRVRSSSPLSGPPPASSNVLRACCRGCRCALCESWLSLQQASHNFGEYRAALRPQAALQAAIILRPAEHVGHQLSKCRAAVDKLDQAGRYRGAQKPPAIEPARDPRREFQVSGKRLANPGGILGGFIRNQRLGK